MTPPANVKAAFAPLSATELSAGAKTPLPKVPGTNNYAASLVAEARAIGGTLAERYLREHRGISGELPPELRFHPAVWCHETRSTHPALLVPALDRERVRRV